MAQRNGKRMMVEAQLDDFDERTYIYIYIYLDYSLSLWYSARCVRRAWYI